MRISNPPDADIEGITLRQIERGDCNAWFDYLRLPVVFERTSWDQRSIDDLLPLVETYMGDSPASPMRMAVVDESIGQLVGTIGLDTISEVNRSAEIAYDFSPSHWGRGLATRLCEAVTAWSFQSLDLHRLQATVLVGNEPSERVLGRCEFRHEGLLRGFRIVRGVPGDFNIFSRLSTDRAGVSDHFVPSESTYFFNNCLGCSFDPERRQISFYRIDLCVFGCVFHAFCDVRADSRCAQIFT